MCTRPPLDEIPLHSCSRAPLDEAPLHYCSMPPIGRGPSALLLHAPIWTRPFCTTAPCPLQDEAPSARIVLLQIKISAEPTTLHAEKTVQIDNYHLSAFKTQLQHPARTLTPSKFCYYCRNRNNLYKTVVKLQLILFSKYIGAFLT